MKLTIFARNQILGMFTFFILNFTSFFYVLGFGKMIRTQRDPESRINPTKKVSSINLVS